MVTIELKAIRPVEKLIGCNPGGVGLFCEVASGEYLVISEGNDAPRLRT